MKSVLRKAATALIGKSFVDEEEKKTYDFDLHKKYITSEKILFRVDGSVYGHPAAGRIAQTDFKALVSSHDYYEHPNALCLFLHSTRPIVFTLIADDIGIKVFNEEDLQHLITTIRSKWEVKLDRTGVKYNGVRLIWDYIRNIPITGIPNYVAESLARLKLPDIKPRFTPAPYPRRTDETKRPLISTYLNVHCVHVVLHSLWNYFIIVDGLILHFMIVWLRMKRIIVWLKVKRVSCFSVASSGCVDDRVHLCTCHPHT